MFYGASGQYFFQEFDFFFFFCSQSGDHPWEDLAKSGYKPPDMK
jgi:hypothetical protein